jgi:hypothetical protein
MHAFRSTFLVAIVCSVLTSQGFAESAHPEERFAPEELADGGTVIGYEVRWQVSDAYRPGEKLSGGSLIEIARCGTLILRTRDRLIVLNGPYKGLLSTYRRQFGCVGGTPPERVTALDYFFSSVCERAGTCDAVCREVFRHVTHKDDMKLQCP